MNNTFFGHTFIIPNSIVTISDNEYDKMWQQRIHRKINLPEEKHYVEVWCLTPNNDDSNWSCHYEMPSEKGEEYGECFPTHLPVSLFEGKKEGDQVTFPTKWGQVTLELHQLKYRYCRFGTFEATLARLLAAAE